MRQHLTEVQLCMILRQFVDNIPINANQWIVFISDSVDIVCDSLERKACVCFRR